MGSDSSQLQTQGELRSWCWTENQAPDYGPGAEHGKKKGLCPRPRGEKDGQNARREMGQDIAFPPSSPKGQMESQWINKTDGQMRVLGGPNTEEKAAIWPVSGERGAGPLRSRGNRKAQCQQ